MTIRGDSSGLELERLRTELAAARRRIDQLESSTSMRLGQTLVASARSPRATVRLPREMMAMWRGRRKSSGKAGRSVDPSHAPAGSNVMMAGLSFTPSIPDGPIVAGVLRDATAAALASTGTVFSVLPHAALELMERLQPDMVLVEAAAAVPPSPWAYLGDPSAPDRLLALNRIRQWAAAADIPIVFWQNSPAHLSVFLDDFARGCDLVVVGPEAHGPAHWSAGVPLAGRVRWGGERAGTVMLGSGDSSAGPARSALLAAVKESLGDRVQFLPDPDAPGAAGMDAGSMRRAARAAKVATFATAVANPFGALSGRHGAHASTLGLLAAGLRVISGPDPDLVGFPGVVFISDARDAPSCVEDAISAGPLTPAEHIDVLRRLHLHWSPGSQLDALQSLVQGRAAAPRQADVSVLTDDLPAAAQALEAQSILPREVVVTRADLDADAAGRIERLGVAVCSVPDGVDIIGAVRTTATVVGPLPDRHILLDLAIVAAATSAASVAVDRSPGTGWSVAGAHAEPAARWDIPA